MPPEDLDRFQKQIASLNHMLSAFKLLVGGLVSCFVGFAYLVIWANNTTSAIAETRHDIQTMTLERTEANKEMAVWRRQKDENDVRLAQIVQSQNEMLSRQQIILDRVSLRIGARE